ncbi:MAG: hypothetical protein J6127_00075 [Clostridiales bacterium]|nr:hypothetical protein [Clostridiales bacterium]
MEKHESVITKYKLALPMIIIAGIFYAVFAIMMDNNAGPDESMRYLVVDWIVKNNKLPIGYEKEIIIPLWGYSYAFTPYLPSMIGSLFAEIASHFTTDAQIIRIACRFVNVFAGAATVFVAFRVGDKILDKKWSVYFMVSTVAFLPQFVFLCGYLNNDVMTLMSAFMILDAVLDGSRDKWSLRSMIYLALGTGIAALTYYFAYGWILFAVAGFFYTCAKQRMNRSELLKKTGTVVLLVFIVAGWYFIRNGIIYHGDFLGYKQQDICTKIYTQDTWLEPVDYPARINMHLREMLFNAKWIEITIQSFIGLFGGMIICLDGKFYDFYFISFVVLTCMFIRYRDKTKEKMRTPFVLILLFEIAFPTALSIYSSYMRDFQPQGRYLIAIVPAIALFTSVGLDEFAKSVETTHKKLGKAVPVIATAVVVLLFALIFYTVMLPTLAFVVLPGADKVSFYYVR